MNLKCGQRRFQQPGDQRDVGDSFARLHAANKADTWNPGPDIGGWRFK